MHLYGIWLVRVGIWQGFNVFRFEIDPHVASKETRSQLKLGLEAFFSVRLCSFVEFQELAKQSRVISSLI